MEIFLDRQKIIFRIQNINHSRNNNTKHALIYALKIRNFPSQLSPSIVTTISDDAPMPFSTFDTCRDCLKRYDYHLYRNSLFYKGPLLVLSSGLNVSPVGLMSMKNTKMI